MVRHAFLILAVALAAASPALAERFDVMLGGRILGTLDYGADHLSSRLDNTPLGVGDGTFDGRVSGGGTRDYVSVGRSGREERRIRVRFEGGRVREVSVDPGSEATDLSVPAAVPVDVLDPVTGFGRVVGAADCPARFRIYDGRRAVEVATTGKRLTADRLTCEMAYRVIAGPGHLSPFRFRHIGVVATYDMAQGRVGGVREIALSAGPFTIRLVR